MSMQVMSQNVMSWEMEGGALFAEKKAVQGADVIGFQEVIPFWKAAFDEDLPEYDSILVYRSETNLEGTPIYWKKERFDKKDAGHFWLSETPEKESFGWGAACVRICCWVQLHDKQDDKDFVFVNTHLDHVGTEARKNGLKLIVEKIAQINDDGYPVVLVGDFNMEPGNKTMAEIDAAMQSARNIAGNTDSHDTFNGWGKGSGIIDYIYVSGFSSCVEYQTVTKRYEDRKFVSDHYPIFARLIF